MKTSILILTLLACLLLGGWDAVLEALVVWGILFFAASATLEVRAVKQARKMTRLRNREPAAHERYQPAPPPQLCSDEFKARLLVSAYNQTASELCLAEIIPDEVGGAVGIQLDGKDGTQALVIASRGDWEVEVLRDTMAALSGDPKKALPVHSN